VYQHVVFHPDNKMVQHVGFAPELLKMLEVDNWTVVGKVTKSKLQQIFYDCEKDGVKGGRNHAHGYKRAILPPDM